MAHRHVFGLNEGTLANTKELWQVASGKQPSTLFGSCNACRAVATVIATATGTATVSPSFAEKQLHGHLATGKDF